jgi:hypothetical protein
MDRKGFVLTLLILIAIVIAPSILFAAQIKLAWDANSEPDLAGYKVYYGTASRVYGTPVSVGNVTTYTVTGLTLGQTYYMAVTALDNATPANESSYSTEVSGAATDPTQPVSITVTTSPAGLQVVVDSTTYTAPRTFSWTAGSSHTLSLSSPQSGVSGTRYPYSSWSDGGAQSHSITVPSSATTYTANFTTQYSLTTAVNPSGSGTITPNPSGTWYNSGASVQLTATAATGYSFSSWTGGVTGSSNPTSITMNSAKSVTANFTAIPGSLSVTPSGGLSASGSQGGPFSPSSQSYALQNTGGSTINWNAAKTQNWVTLSSTSGSLAGGATATVTTSINSTANSLGAGTYSDTVTFTNTTNGSGNTTRSVNLTVSAVSTAVTVTTNPAGLQISADGTSYTAPRTFNWVAGSSHTLSLSSPQSGTTGIQYAYSSWSNSGAQSHSITVPSSATTYTANFTTQYSLTASATPVAGGTVSPSGTNWYNNGQSINLSATPNSGYNFGSWSGVISGTANPVPITMDGPKNATANFTTQTQYTLTVNASPSGSGSVSLNPNKATYSSGEQVTLTANANSGYGFSSWSGNLTGTTNPVSITVDGNKTVTANFAATPGTLVVTPLNGLTTSGSAGGPFTPSSAGYILQNTGGTTLNWIASAVQTWISLSSSNGSLAPGASITITVSINDSAKSLLPGSYNDTVSFSETTATSRAYGASNATRPVTLTVNGTMLSYRVATNPTGLRVKVDGTEYKTPKKFTWAVGSSHSLEVSSPLTASSGKRYVFTSWSDGSGQSLIITAPSSSTTYTASFTTQYNLATSVNIPEGGTVGISAPSTGNPPKAGADDPAEGIWYDKGQVVTLSATPNFEYNLRSWSNGSRNNPLSITMNAPKKIRANFKQNTYTIKVLSNSLGVVTKSPNKLTYVYGEQVTFTAKPKSGYILGNWTGDVGGIQNQNPLIVTVAGNMSVGASFTTFDGPPQLPSGDSLADSSADSLTLIGELESPVDGKSISGVKPIYGWALDGEGISKVELFIDGTYVCDIPPGGMREDIGAEQPQYPNADKSGFAMIWNYSAMSPGEHIVKVKVHSLKGEAKDLAATVFVNKFYAETVNQVAPQDVWVYDVSVTGDGTTNPYDLKLEWSDQSQGFEIIEVVPR